MSDVISLRAATSNLLEVRWSVVSLRRTLEGIAKAHTHLSSVPLRIRRQLGLLGGMIADPMRINQVLANGLVNAAKVRTMWRVRLVGPACTMALSHRHRGHFRLL